MWFAVPIAYFVKGIAGFANTLVFSSIMNFFTKNINIVPVDLLLGTPSNLIVMLRERRQVQWKKAALLILFMTLGMLPGVLFLKNGEDRLLKIILGVVILLLGVEMLTRSRRKPSAFTQSPLFINALALFSGTLMGTFGIGATMVVCVERMTSNTRSMRGTLCAVFLADNVIRTILYIATGVLTWDIALTALRLVPVMIVGLFLGMKLAGRLPDKTVRFCIILMLMLTGLSLTLTTILR